MPEVRVLTVRQPWAWAIIHGGKDIENRVRNVAGAYRGPVAIHVAQADAESAPESLWLDHAGWYRARYPQPNKFSPEWSDRGLIIGVVDLVDVHHADDCWERDKQRLIALYRSGPEGRTEVAEMPDDGPGGIIGKTRFCSPWAQDEAHHLVLANPRPLSDPIPYRGALGLRRLPDDVAALLAGEETP